MLRVWLTLATAVWLALPLAGQELLFRHDGVVGRERSALAVPVREGQQLLFRVASLDFAPRASLSFNGATVNFGAGDGAVAEQYLRVKQAGSVQFYIEGNPAPGSSYQLRVVRLAGNAALPHNAVVKGSISSRDPADQDGKRIDWYPLRMQKGQRLLVGAVARPGDARLQLELPDGRTLANDDRWGSDPGLVFDAEETGTAWVGVGMDNLPAAGAYAYHYSLFVRDLPTVARSLALGQAQTVNFVPVGANLPCQPEGYSFTAPRSGIYQFSLTARDGQPGLLRLRLPSREEISAGGFRDGSEPAAASCYLRANQRVELSAEAFGAEARDKFTLDAGLVGSAVVLRDGDRFEQELRGGRLYFVYRGKPGEYVDFLLGSNDFRPRISASDEGGQTLVWSNYFGSDFTHAARGGYYFEQAGELVLEARGGDSQDAGRFLLQVRSLPAGSPEAPREWSAGIVLGERPLFVRLTGAAALYEGHYGHEYALELKAGELVRVAMRSGDFDCRLQLSGPDGQPVVANDDFEGSDSMVEFVAPRTGRYQLRALSWIEEGARVNASYQLQLRRLGAAAPLAGEAAVQGGVLNPDSLTDAGRPYQDVAAAFKAGQRIYALASGVDFNPRLQIISPEGMVLDDNAGFGQEGQARVDWTVKAGGAYRFRIIAADGDARARLAWTLALWEIK